jgi:NADH-quinone oxidoreductase subunit N
VISGNFEAWMFLAILPEILLLVLAIVVIALELVLPREKHDNLGWVTAGGLATIIGVSLAIGRPGAEGQIVWGGMLRFDWLGFTFKILFLFSAAITALFAIDLKNLGRRGEFYLLMLASTLGMTLMASAANLIMLYLAIETTSIPLYVLAGFFTHEDKSTESGFKYLLFGAMTSAIMLYGFSLLYGFAGTTDIYALAESFQEGQLAPGILLGTLLLVLVGFGFKISAVPFHFWAPDVYEGAPTPIAGFLSTASKAAGFAVVLRVLIAAFPAIAPYWGAVVAAFSVASMTLGNLLALAQKNIKRLLAYSSIAHAGYALIGVVAISTLGTTSVVYYLIAYVITNLAAFGIVTAFSRIAGSDDIAAFAGLSRRSPWLAISMMVAFLSLAGMPPFAGFVVKVSVFAAAIQAGLVWLAVIGVLNSIVGLYYYLIVLKVVYLYRSEDEEKPIPVSRPYVVGLAILSIGIILVGTVLAPWFGMASTAAAAIIPGF